MDRLTVNHSPIYQKLEDDGMTLLQLSRVAGVSYWWLSRAFNGHIAIPKAVLDFWQLSDSDRDKATRRQAELMALRKQCRAERAA